MGTYNTNLQVGRETTQDGSLRHRLLPLRGFRRHGCTFSLPLLRSSCRWSNEVGAGKSEGKGRRETEQEFLPVKREEREPQTLTLICKTLRTPMWQSYDEVSSDVDEL
jgi:hypothetical protein